MGEFYNKIKYNDKINIYLNQEIDLTLDNIKDNIDKYLNIANRKESFYAKRNRKVIKDNLSGDLVYAKNYSPFNAEKLHDKLRNITFKKSVALREFEALLLLEKLDFPVVKPLLAVEKTIYPFIKESTVITMGFMGLEAEEVMMSSQYDYNLKKEVMKQAANNLLMLHQANVVHNDYRFRNILIDLSNDKFELALLDLERAKKNYYWKYRKVKDWAKLIADWANILLHIFNSKLNKLEIIKKEIKEYKSLVIKEYSLNKLYIKIFNKLINKIFIANQTI